MTFNTCHCRFYTDHPLSIWWCCKSKNILLMVMTWLIVGEWVSKCPECLCIMTFCVLCGKLASSLLLSLLSSHRPLVVNKMTLLLPLVTGHLWLITRISGPYGSLVLAKDIRYKKFLKNLMNPENIDFLKNPPLQK